MMTMGKNLYRLSGPFALCGLLVSCISDSDREVLADGVVPWGANTSQSSLQAAPPDRYLVQFNHLGRATAALEAAGATVVLPLLPHNALAVIIPAPALPGLANNPNIDFIEPDPLRVPLAETVPYGIPMVQADQVPDPALGASSAKKVCIIDTGIYRAHIDFQSTHVAGESLVDGEAWDTESAGHGTHVAGTIAAIGGNDEGVVGVLANGVDLYIVKVFPNGGGGASGSTIIKALDQCVANGAKVVNMSLGGALRSRVEDKAFESAYNGGVLLVAAAGNSGGAEKSYPASYKSVISVAAVDASEVVAPFSQHNKEVEIAAPGVSVLSTVPWTDDSTLTVSTFSTTPYQGSHITNSGQTDPVDSSTDPTGALADGGLCSSEESTTAWAGKVVLCERGDFTFEEKVLSVQAGGGIAAVIYNNVPGGFTGWMSKQTDPVIPAIGISQADGQALDAGAIGQEGTVHSVVTDPDSGYALFSGTSMATPHVAGVGSLVWNGAPSLTNVDIRDALNTTAKDLGASGKDSYYGHGLAQAYAAWQSVFTGCSQDSECADGNICTTDTCGTDGLCSNTAVVDGTSCADGDACNGDETCQVGECTAGTALDCSAFDDNNVCTSECSPDTGCHEPTPVADGTSCADGDVCNGDETCQGGLCDSDTALDCSDPDPCIITSCDPSTGCSSEPDPSCCKANGEKCNGNLECCSGACFVGKGGPPRCG